MSCQTSIGLGVSVEFQTPSACVEFDRTQIIYILVDAVYDYMIDSDGHYLSVI